MKEEYVLDNHCPTCGANLKYNPDTSSWKCEFCRVDYTLNQLNNSKNSVNNMDSSNVGSDSLVTLKCKNCGAEIVCDEQVAATTCVYCRNTAIIRSKLSNKFKPDLIIPFKVGKDKAIEAFKNISKGRKFVPNDFNNEYNINEIKGVYIPFWLYDVSVDGEIIFSGTKVHTWIVGDTHYTETSYYDLIRDVSMNFTKIPVDGSTRFNNDIMNSIEPFDYSELVEYNHLYLAGFLAEKYDVDSENAYIDAKNRLLNSTKDTVKSSCSSFLNLREKQNSLKENITAIKYVLLPVWMVNVKYKGKIYIFAMNGQTGEFIGDIPLDKGKRNLYFIKIFLITALIVLAISYFVY